LVLVLGAWRYFNPDDAYLPLAFTSPAVLLFLASLALRRSGGGWHLQLLLIAFAYAAIGPIAGWITLAQFADPGGFVGDEHFEKTSLYLTSALSVVVLGVLISAYALLVRSLEAGISASAVLMLAVLLGIGRYSPENVQFYTVPVGAYLFVLGAVTTRLRALMDEWRAMLQPLITLGPSVIMAPTFLQSLDADAWEYGLVLLAESLAFIGIAIVQRWSGLLSVSIGFLVLDGGHYLFFADGGGGATLPTWAILTMAGILVMLAGTAILFSRDRWSAWQQALRVWWYQQPRG
jgi:hypothetical protein